MDGFGRPSETTWCLNRCGIEVFQEPLPQPSVRRSTETLVWDSPAVSLTTDISPKIHRDTGRRFPCSITYQKTSVQRSTGTLVGDSPAVSLTTDISRRSTGTLVGDSPAVSLTTDISPKIHRDTGGGFPCRISRCQSNRVVVIRLQPRQSQVRVCHAKKFCLLDSEIIVQDHYDVTKVLHVLALYSSFCIITQSWHCWQIWHISVSV